MKVITPCEFALKYKSWVPSILNEFILIAAGTRKIQEQQSHLDRSIRLKYRSCCCGLQLLEVCVFFVFVFMMESQHCQWLRTRTRETNQYIVILHLVFFEAFERYLQ